jgi:hypothetical protein
MLIALLFIQFIFFVVLCDIEARTHYFFITCPRILATFLLLFPKTPIFSTFDATMAIWLYGHIAIMASNSHMGIWPLWHHRWPLWVFSETPIKMWQSGGRIIDNVLFGQITDRTEFQQKQMEQRFNKSYMEQHSN